MDDRRIFNARPVRNAALIGLVFTTTAMGCGTGSLPIDPEPPVTLTRLPLGERGVSYAGLDEEETEAWGPSGLRVQEDGTIWTLDAAASRAIHFDGQGQLLDTVDLDGLASGPVDLYVRDDEMFLLDRAAMVPTVVRISLSGVAIDSAAIPMDLEARAQGFVTDDGNGLWLSFGGTEVAEVSTEGGSLQLGDVHASLLNGQAITLDFPDTSSFDEIGHELVVSTGAGQTTIHMDGFVSSVSLLALHDDGSFVLSMEEVTFDPVVLVDSTVWHIAADGSVLAKAREPVSDQLVFVPRALALHPSGALLALQTDRGGASIVGLPWQTALEPILQDEVDERRDRDPIDDEAQTLVPSGLAGAVAVTSQAATRCLRREDMIVDGFAYVNNWTWLSTKNVDRGNTRCAGRDVPRYFRTAAQTKAVNSPSGCSGEPPSSGYTCIRSVPYDWGGWLTVEGYRTAMKKGSQAGDVNTADIESCSAGVDCSGLIGRVWKTNELPRTDGTLTTSRPTTRSLDKWSKPVSAANGHPSCATCDNRNVVIYQGDILLNPGSHVSMFRRYGETTIPEQKGSGRFPLHIEATKGRGYDRVSYAAWPWKRYGSFQPRSFIHACPIGS